MIDMIKYEQGPLEPSDIPSDVCFRPELVEAHLTTDDVAKVLNVTTRTIKRWIKGDKIPVKTVGRFKRFSPKELNDWLETNRVS